MFFRKIRSSGSDKASVGPLLSDAESILTAAQSAAGATATDFTILISLEGGIHIACRIRLATCLAGIPLWRSHPLYLVTQASGRITVEGRSGLARCRLQAEYPRAVAPRQRQDQCPTSPRTAETM